MKKNLGSTTSADAGVKVYVNVGMTNDIDTEIVEEENGLKKGDEVVSKIISSTATTKPAATTFSLFGNRGGGGASRTNTAR